MDVLLSLAKAGHFRVGVPRPVGGCGGNLGDVLHAVAEAAEHRIEHGVVLAAQRLIIEALVQSDNIGLMEYQMPGLLDGETAGSCAASWPQGRPVVPAVARDTSRGWRANGTLPAIPNLPPNSFLVSAPIRFEGSDGYSLLLLKSSEDGINRQPAGAAQPCSAHVAGLELRNVFLREDEILASEGARTVEKLSILSLGMRAALLGGACRQVVREGASGTRAKDHLALVDSLLQGAADLVRQQRRPDAPLLALRQELDVLAGLRNLAMAQRAWAEAL